VEYLEYSLSAFLPDDFHGRPDDVRAQLLEAVSCGVVERLRLLVRVGTPEQIEDFSEYLAQVGRVWLPGTDYTVPFADIKRILPHAADPMWITPLCVGPGAGRYDSAERVKEGVLLRGLHGMYHAGV